MGDQRKIKFVNNLQAKLTGLASIVDDIDTLREVYLDRGYESGGSDEITAPDIEGMDLSLAEVSEIATLLVDLNKFIKNQTVTQTDRSATLSKFREDI
jgi:hypothetical protein